MKKIFIVANWKSNKTIKETEEWLHDFNEGLKAINLANDKQIVLAPSFTSLEHAKYCLGNLKLPISLSSQNISPYEKGPYTGEVAGSQIKEFAEYAIVGHSERRKYFFEQEDMINKKIDQAIQNNLIPILCISDIKQIQSLKLENNNMIIACEPLFAIGTGNPDTPENANNVGKNIKEILGTVSVLYGGSITSINVNSFTQMPNIDGVLVGGSSLNPQEFLEIVKNA